MYGLVAEGHFDSAHFLADYHGKCENLHGHRWKVVATFESDALQDSGDERAMVCDFATVKAAVSAACRELDHTTIYETGTLAPATVAALEAEGFTLTELSVRPTAENLARHLFDRIGAQGLPVVQVEVDETPNNRCFYRADD